MTTGTTTNGTVGTAQTGDDRKPSVLFVRVHNAGRSQMAAAYLNHLPNGRIEVLSAGSQPADQVNPAAVEAMKEEASTSLPRPRRSSPLKR